MTRRGAGHQPFGGSEYYLSKIRAMRGGFYTNHATPEISSSNVNQSEHIDLYGLTASLSHFTRNTSVTLGAGYTFGEGQAQIIGNSTRAGRGIQRLDDLPLLVVFVLRNTPTNAAIRGLRPFLYSPIP
jgi:hypothetical protein